MKRFTLIFASLIFFITSSNSFAENYSVKKDSFNRELVVKNLLVGIKSENYGLRTSSAFLLGELKADEAVIELLRMLHKEDSDDARILAALSLLKIEDSRGIYAIRQAVKFDKSERVRRICEKFYHHFIEQ